MDVACVLMILLLSRLRADVRKIVLSRDVADSQPVRFDFILQPPMRHVDVFHFVNSLPVENVHSGSCTNDQHWLHCKTQVAHHALNAIRF